MNPRRSWLILPAHDPAAVTRCQEFKPDVAVLDLEYSVPPRHKESARAGLEKLVRAVGQSETAVFVRVDRETRWADVRAAMFRGIQGIVFPGPEEPGEVAELGELITTMEKEQGVDPGDLYGALQTFMGHASITITNSAGQTDYSGSYSLKQGNSSFVWDGKGNDGVQWPAGTYTLTATGKDSSGNNVAISTEVQGIVDSVDLTASPPLLSIGGQNYTTDKIRRVVRQTSS